MRPIRSIYLSFSPKPHAKYLRHSICFLSHLISNFDSFSMANGFNKLDSVQHNVHSHFECILYQSQHRSRSNVEKSCPQPHHGIRSRHVARCPILVQDCTHRSHHRYNQGQGTPQRIEQVITIIFLDTYPAFSIGPVRHLRNDYINGLSYSSPEFRKVIIQHALLFLLWGIALSFDWQRTLILIVIPQLIGIHFLMASNYLQHADCEVGSEYNHSRNFTGKLFNFMFLNVGYHTAHHLHDRIHWTELPALHEISNPYKAQSVKPVSSPTYCTIWVSNPCYRAATGRNH